MKPFATRPTSARGVTMMDIVVTVAVIGTMAAVATPVVKNQVDGYRLGMATRDVERELQYARLKAVSSAAPMRVRFDCPAAGQVRVVELIGTPPQPDAADTASNRCSETAYPYRPNGGDGNRLTVPNNDGPIRYLQPGVSFSQSKTLEFWPDGSVHAETTGTTPWPPVGSAGATISLTRNGVTKNIVVNNLGKIQMDR